MAGFGFWADRGQSGGNPLPLKAGFAVLRTADLGCWRDHGVRSLKRSLLTLPGDNRTMSVPRSLPWLHRGPLKFNLHSPAGDIRLRQHHAHRTSESSDMLLYLAGVNEHASCAFMGASDGA